MSVVSAAETSLEKVWHAAIGNVVARSFFNLFRSHSNQKERRVASL